MSTVITPRNSQTQLPSDILLEVFLLLRDTATFHTTTPPLFNRQDSTVTVGPPVGITQVCRFWHEVATSCPALWSSIPILVESGKLLALANPGQVKYYLERVAKAYKMPLTLIIGTRRQLFGSGVRGEEPWERHSLDFISSLASRVRHLAVAFDLNSQIASALSCNISHLESVVFLGTPPSSSQLQEASFWQSSRLRRVVWGVSGTRPIVPPILTDPWVSLTEVLFPDESEMVLPGPLVHAFFRAAKELVKFQSHVLDVPPGCPGEISEHHSLPLLEHLNLQTLILTFRGKLRDHHYAPELLCALRLPQLRHFSFKMDWSAGFNPVKVTSWLCTDSQPRHLTRFECRTVYIDTSDLLQAIYAMPALEVLRCYGGVIGERQRFMRSQLVRDRKWILDSKFLHCLANPMAYNTSTAHVSDHSILQEGMPCPLLRELYIVNGYFSKNGIETFLRARVYGAAGLVQSGALGWVCLQ